MADDLLHSFLNCWYYFGAIYQYFLPEEYMLSLSLEKWADTDLHSLFVLLDGFVSTRYVQQVIINVHSVKLQTLLHTRGK